MTTITRKAFMTTVLGLSLFSVLPAFAKTTKAEPLGIHAFSDAIRSSPSAVIAFHSTSCGTCKVQKPRLQALLLKEQNSQIKDVFLDFDNEGELRNDLKVAYPSTIIVFKNGTEVGRVTGETNEVKIQTLLNKSIL